jgi:hypothetical protein
MPWIWFSRPRKDVFMTSSCIATPERRILFAINDLNVTHPAPWAWDLKRLAANFVIACRAAKTARSAGCASIPPRGTG